MRVVAYYRVSTQRQGVSGLGLDAQRKTVADYVADVGAEIVAEFEEVESGSNPQRPKLAAALALARKQKAAVCIAKIDRLGRSVSFVTTLLDSRVKIIVADMPNADIAFLQQAAVFAEWELRKIRERTKNALAAAKKRGTQLGTSMEPTRAQKGALANQGAARLFAANVLPIIADVRKAGVTTLAGIAGALNARGIATARGGEWHASTVRNALAYAA